MELQCFAQSGCLFSNSLSEDTTLGVVKKANQTHINACIPLKYQEILTGGCGELCLIVSFLVSFSVFCRIS